MPIDLDVTGLGVAAAIVVLFNAWRARHRAS